MKILKYILGFVAIVVTIFAIYYWGPRSWNWITGKTKKVADNLGGGKLKPFPSSSTEPNDDFHLPDKRGKKRPHPKRHHHRDALNTSEETYFDNLKLFEKRSSRRSRVKWSDFSSEEPDSNDYEDEESNTPYNQNQLAIVPYKEDPITQMYNTPEKKKRLGKLTPHQMEHYLKIFDRKVHALIAKYGTRVGVEYLENLSRWWNHFRNVEEKKRVALEYLENEIKAIPQLEDRIDDLEKEADQLKEDLAKSQEKVTKLESKIDKEKKRYGELEAEKNGLKERLAKKHQTALDEMGKKYEEQKEVIKNLKGEIKSLKRHGKPELPVNSWHSPGRTRGDNEPYSPLTLYQPAVEPNLVKHPWLEIYQTPNGKHAIPTYTTSGSCRKKKTKRFLSTRISSNAAYVAR